MNNSKIFQKVKLSPFPIEAELFFNASYFLQSDYSTSPSSSSSSEEEKMEVEPVRYHHIPLRREIPVIKREQQLQQQLQQHQFQQQQQQLQQHLQQQQQLQQQPYMMKRDLIYNDLQRDLVQGPSSLMKREMMQSQQHKFQQRESMLHQQTKNTSLLSHREMPGHVHPIPKAPVVSKPTTRSLNSQHADLITKATHNHNAMLSNVNTGTNYKSAYSPMISAQQTTNMLAEEYEKLVDSFNQVHEKEKESQNFKLPSSKSPIMEALVYCSINKYGIELKELNTTTNKILFYVSDFNVYYKQSCSICSKQSPSEDIRARMKALQRWFVTFPAWRELEYPFELLVRPSHYNKMHEIISKMVRFYENVEIDTDAITDIGED
jgi:hypothetical protein